MGDKGMGSQGGPAKDTAEAQTRCLYPPSKTRYRVCPPRQAAGPSRTRTHFTLGTTSLATALNSRAGQVRDGAIRIQGHKYISHIQHVF